MLEPGQRFALLRCAAEQVTHAVVGHISALRQGIAHSRAQVPRYADAWASALVPERGPLWVALGDSSAQGVGAAAHSLGYVGQLKARLDQRDGKPWRLRNLSVSGARVADVLHDQLPRLDDLGETPDLVTCAVGANDLLRTPITRLLVDVRALISGLPDGAVIATLPQGLAQWRARRVNEVIRAEGPAAGLRVADVWAETGAPWRGKYAADMFHPNGVGYLDWARAFAVPVGL